MRNLHILIILCINLIIFTFSSYAKYIFVSNENSDTVVVLDKQSKKIIKTIETGGRPRDLKFNFDFSKLYVVVSEENHLLEIDTKKLKILDKIKTGDDPEIFDIDYNNNYAAVSNEDDNQLTIINLNNKKIIARINDVGVEPEGVNFSPDGKLIYVTSEGTSSVLIIDATEKKIVNEILVGNRPRRGLFVNGGTEYWVSNELSGTVGVIDTAKQEIKKTIKFTIKGIREQQITPVDFAYAKKNSLVFVTLGRANHVAVVDANTYEIKKYILVGNRVWGADVTEDEKELIVTNGNSDDISIIDLEKFLSTSAIPVGKTPHSVRIMK
jgi:PQQ-dependent catabolism-associated beta-propeller protein